MGFSGWVCCAEGREVWGDVGCCDGSWGGRREGLEVGKVGCFMVREGWEFIGD